jgi:hypothetical protein
LFKVLLSDKPEYNEKIKAGFLLAPAAIMTNAYSPVFLLTAIAEAVEDFLHLLGIYEFLPHPGAYFMNPLLGVTDPEHTSSSATPFSNT